MDVEWRQAAADPRPSLHQEHHNEPHKSYTVLYYRELYQLKWIKNRPKIIFLMTSIHLWITCRPANSWRFPLRRTSTRHRLVVRLLWNLDWWPSQRNRAAYSRAYPPGAQYQSINQSIDFLVNLRPGSRIGNDMPVKTTITRSFRERKLHQSWNINWIFGLIYTSLFTIKLI